MACLLCSEVEKFLTRRSHSIMLAFLNEEECQWQICDRGLYVKGSTIKVPPLMLIKWLCKVDILSFTNARNNKLICLMYLTTYKRIVCHIQTSMSCVWNEFAYEELVGNMKIRPKLSQHKITIEFVFNIIMVNSNHSSNRQNQISWMQVHVCFKDVQLWLK